MNESRLMQKISPNFMALCLNPTKQNNITLIQPFIQWLATLTTQLSLNHVNLWNWRFTTYVITVNHHVAQLIFLALDLSTVLSLLRQTQTSKTAWVCTKQYLLDNNTLNRSDLIPQLYVKLKNWNPPPASTITDQRDYVKPAELILFKNTTLLVSLHFKNRP